MTERLAVRMRSYRYDEFNHNYGLHKGRVIFEDPHTNCLVPIYCITTSETDNIRIQLGNRKAKNKQ